MHGHVVSDRKPAMDQSEIHRLVTHKAGSTLTATAIRHHARCSNHSTKSKLLLQAPTRWLEPVIVGSRYRISVSGLSVGSHVESHVESQCRVSRPG
jgi:hypothetical protein